MPRPPLVDLGKLTRQPHATPLQPNLLGYSAQSWQELVAEYGPVVRAEVAGKEQLLLCGHDADLHAWKTPGDWLYGPPVSSGDFFSSQMGPTHITQQDGAAHRRSRKLLLPGFGIAAISRDIEAIAQTISEGFQAIQDKPLELHSELCFLYGKALSRSQIKTPQSDDTLRTLQRFEEEFITGLNLPAEEQQLWHSRPEYLALKARAFAVFDDIIRARTKDPERRGAEGIEADDTLERLLRPLKDSNFEPLQPNELRSAVYLLLVAGVGNVSALACCMLWSLTEQPHWLECVRAEVADFEGQQMRGGLKNFPVLQAVVAETERCFLPAPVIPKMTSRAIQVLGYDVPVDTHVLQLLGCAHFDPARYADPHRFAPERWLDGGAQRANAYGGGIHLCLGMGVSRVLLPLTLAQFAKNHVIKTSERPFMSAVTPGAEISPLAPRYPATLAAHVS